MNLRRFLLLPLSCVLLATQGAQAADTMDPQLKEKARRAVDAGLHYLRGQQAENGSMSNSVGITALALRGFLESHRGYNEGDGPFITRQVEFMLSKVNPDGSICESLQNRSYTTAVALNALVATGNPKYADAIANGQKFLKGHQIDEGEGYDKSHRYYGGIGYGGDERPDMSNLYIALEALKASSADPKDPVWEKAMVFVNRSQNRSESNDQEWAKNDGGGIYMPGWNPPEYGGGTGSYGGMTAANLISLLFAGADRKDPRVQDAYKWITSNFTLETNPGTSVKHGLYYYYNALAKVMYAYGDAEFIDGQGQKHNWRNELTQKLLALQNPDGSWVNKDSNKWGENNPQLVTAWSVIALAQVVR